MKILLVTNYPNDRQMSMLHFANMLETGLATAGCEVRAVHPKPVLAGTRNTGRGLSKWLGYLDKFIIFPSVLRREMRWADLIHITDHSNAVYTKIVRSKPHLVTCNDLIAVRSALGEIPAHQTGFMGRRLQQWILGGLKKAGHVACISKKTRDDVERLVGLPAESVEVVYMGLNFPYKRMPAGEARARLEKLGVPTQAKLILHVGGDHWYKNRDGVLRIYEALVNRSQGTPPSLVMAGAPLSEAQREIVTRFGWERLVFAVHGCEAEDLQALYSSAELLVFPSLEEGFGWPIAEAQSCGCPAVTTNRAPMTEVGGDAALYIDPADADDAASVIQRLMNESRAEIARRVDLGYENARRFSPEGMVEQYTDIYRRLLDHGQPREVLPTAMSAASH